MKFYMLANPLANQILTAKKLVFVAANKAM